MVMSSIGAMFAPHHQDVADEMVRVCRPRRDDRDAQLDARRHDRGPVQDDGTVRARRLRPARSPRRSGAARSTSRSCSEIASTFRTLDRDVLEITAFERPRDYGEHFKAKYGPTIAARKNASSDGREGDLDDALDRFCDEWNLGSEEDARFEQEYLVVVGTRA